RARGGGGARPKRSVRVPLQPSYVGAALVCVLGQRPRVPRADEPLHVPARNAPALSATCMGSAPPSVRRGLGMASILRAYRVPRRLPPGGRSGAMVLLPLYRGPASHRRCRSGLHVCELTALESSRGRSDHSVPHADGDVPRGLAHAPHDLRLHRVVPSPVLSRLRRLLSIGQLPVRDHASLPRPHGTARGLALPLSGADRPSLYHVWRPDRRVLHRAGGSLRPVRSTARGLAGTGVDRRPKFLLVRRSAGTPRRCPAEMDLAS